MAKNGMEVFLMENKIRAVKKNRPQFLEELSNIYSNLNKNVVVLSGGINDIFWDEKGGTKGDGDFIKLDTKFYLSNKDKFHMIKMDINGIGFYDKEEEKEIAEICEQNYNLANDQKISNLKQTIGDNRHNSLASLVILKEITTKLTYAHATNKKNKPLFILVQHSSSLFPAGEINHLSELDRQRIVFFLDWINDPLFRNSENLIILVNLVQSEINLNVKNVSYPIEIPLPGKIERLDFTNVFVNHFTDVLFEKTLEQFAEDTAGLTLETVGDLLKEAYKTKKTITRETIVKEVNGLLQKQLGDIIRVKYPTHQPSDVVGYVQTGKIFEDIFEQCEDPETAVSAILVSGPNGSGKTFQLEAYAAKSRRVVIELAGLRGSYFGETDKFFELLRWNIANFGKVLILVDEAHTAFGSVHSSDTHETEKRLAGNIIKMMGDPSFLGKVLWGLMTSRPDELDPDVKSRSPLQIPIFDLEGDERKTFITELFKRKNIEVVDNDLNQIIAQTDYYSARDFRNFLAQVKGQRKKYSDISLLEVLKGWQASKSIKIQREFQTLIAAQHCSYPNLLPEWIKKMEDIDISKRVEELKWMLKI